jgi:purine-binding chemotaxis protein CheW
MSQQITTIQSYLTFRLGDETFSANVSKVSEILEIPKITKVPRSPDFMRGVINLRGSVLPVIDAPVKFGLPTVTDTVETCIVVMNITIEGQPMSVGVLVNAVSDVMEIDESTIQAAPTVGSKYKTEFIEGMVKLDEQFIMILNLDLVFSTDEVSIMQELSNDKGE